MDVTGVHFIVVNWCGCETAETRYILLLRAKLFPSTFKKPSTAFTFAILDDFLRDNLECGTSGMNYYSKLLQITSSVFPHLIPDRYHELLWVVQKWQYLKLLKWNGFCGTTRSAEKGGLALFCAACPQPGINVDTNEDLDHWQFTCTVVMDGNFKKSKDQVWLMDGLGYMVTNPHYMDYLKATPHIMEKSTCNNHRAIRIKQVVCFYDINCSYMMNLWKHVGQSELIDIPSSLWIIPGIGIWHVHGHKKECYAWYALLFIKGARWMNDSNFMKMIWIG
ncbi:hypothetical protein BKA82DRAFT_4328481 [Pisolithus tinctorius]|nr:hypothetical protein BKA82DRAFT_4328481 [Pisolithus tinctorius]